MTRVFDKESESHSFLSFNYTRVQSPSDKDAILSFIWRLFSLELHLIRTLIEIHETRQMLTIRLSQKVIKIIAKIIVCDPSSKWENDFWRTYQIGQLSYRRLPYSCCRAVWWYEQVELSKKLAVWLVWESPNNLNGRLTN